MVAGMATASAILLSGVSYVALGKTFQALASMKMFFTFRKEGEGQLIMVNGKLSHPLGSLPGSCRAYELEGFTPTDDPRDRWTWVTDTRPPSKITVPQWLTNLNLFKGIAFIGFGEPLSYGFRWTRAHFPKPKGGSSEGEIVSEDGNAGMMVIGAQSEIMDYVFINDVVYHITVPEPETMAGERLPLNISFSVTLQIVNEVKALLSTYQWFEMLVQRFIPSARNFIGSKGYDQLLDLHADAGKSLPSLTNDVCFISFVEEMLKTYGVEIKKIQVYSLDPNDTEREATVAVYKARQEALVKTTLADADAYTIKVVNDAIALHPFGEAVELAHAIRDSKLPGTIVFGGATTSIAIPTTNNGQRVEKGGSSSVSKQTDTHTETD